jgi:penicillin-binding protein 2
MSQDTDRYKLFSRRAIVLGGLKIGVFGGLAARLGYLQISEQQKFQTMSDKNRIGHRMLPASRGEIVDRFGVPLAVNNQNFRAFIIPEQIEDLDRIFDKLSNFIFLSEFEIEEVRIAITKQRRFTPVLIKEGLNWQQTARLEFHLPELPGLFIEEGEVRHYPLGPATAHLIGYVGRVSETEMTSDPIMSMPGFRIGKTGIEKKYDPVLRGKAGSVRTEVNAVGREIRELAKTESEDGHRVKLTIDAELQIYCQELLAQHKSASCVVMDSQNGQVYALCSSPSFDPNLFSFGISAEQWEELLSNPAVPLTNKAIAGHYPPGSTFKIVTALAALEAGIIDDSTSFYCRGYHEVGRDRFHCWKASGHGHVNLKKSLQQSCDVFYYEVAEKLGIEKIAQMSRRLGLGDQLGIEIPGERSGLVPDKNWKRGHFGTKWQLGETVIASIGQGYLLTTPLQLATMTARVINGKKAVKPILTYDVEGLKVPKPEWPELNINQRHLDLVIQGMNAVTMSEKGTARAARIKEEGMSMGGKTGTAQVRRTTRAQRRAGVKNEDLPWKDRHHALFIAHAPIDNPRYVCAVVVEHGVSGSGTAAPLARDIMTEVQRRNPAINQTSGSESL